jgi:peptide/nickel transport system permease protein
MLRYLVSRLLYMLPVVWLVVSVVFLLIHLVPGDPIQQMLGESAAAADVVAARHAYGLDVPLGKQYVNYWRGILHGDMGRSLRLNQNVGHVIAQAYPATMQLTLAALLVALGRRFPPGFAPHCTATVGTIACSASYRCLGCRFPTLRLDRSSFCFSRLSWDGCRSRALVL